MDGPTILTWNVPNWITVVLMAVLGFAAIGLVANSVNKMSANNAVINLASCPVGRIGRLFF
jgi:hypothetical protein